VVHDFVLEAVGQENGVHNIAEFGCGTATPIISALLGSSFLGTITGYDINGEAINIAQRRIYRAGLFNQYKVHNISFFGQADPSRFDCVIANPPYLPCERKDELFLPDLWGGRDGTDVSLQIISMGFPAVLLLVSSYSNPRDLFDVASSHGYRVENFQVNKMPFGVYSRQDVVQVRIAEMKKHGQAYYTDSFYLTAGVLFVKDSNKKDHKNELLHCLESIS
jgi:methylase of polypeptide subunit release factors